MKKIQEDIKKHAFHRFYLLYGEESYLVRLYRDKLKEAVLDGADGMNYSSFQGNGINLEEVRDIANTLPFFHDYRVIILEDTKLFQSANNLAEFLPEMPDSTVFIFAEKKIDKRNKLYKYIQKNGLAIEMKPMGTQDTKKFIAGKLNGSGRKIKESTVDYFLGQADSSLNNIENELEKLIAYTYGREEITCADIDAVCSVQVTGQIFQMLDAAAVGKKHEVFALYHDLLILQERPMSILYLLVRHFNILFQVKTMPDGISRQDIAKKAGVPPFAVGKYQSQCKNFTEKQLKAMLTMCIETECHFKQGKISDQIGLETLLAKLLMFSGQH